MNVWTILLVILGWILVCALVVVAVILLIGVITYAVQTINTALARAKRKRGLVTSLSDDAILELADEYLKSRGLDLFGHNTEFINGAKFALAAKRGDNADRI